MSTIPTTSSYMGGNFTKGGRLGCRPDGKHYFKTFVFLERLVRFDLAKARGTSLLSDKEIGKVLNRSVQQLNWYRKQTAYLVKRVELTSGIGLDATKDVEKAINIHKQQLRMMLPTALRTVFDVVSQPLSPTATLAEKKFKVEVAKDILDREGTFPKISRTDAHVKHEHNFSDLDGVSKDLLDSIDVPVQEAKPQSVEEMLRTNAAFSNTATLSAQEMEASLASLEAMPVSGEIQ